MNNVQGDLITLALAGEFDVVAHGCNCKGLMGAGIAAQIAKTFPMAKFADLKYKGAMKDLFGVEMHERAMLGSVSMAVHQKVTIINAYTQIEPGANFELYGGLTASLHKIGHMFPGKKIGLPKIGAGIGGGDWNSIYKHIVHWLQDNYNMKVTIVEYVEPVVPKKSPVLR